MLCRDLLDKLDGQLLLSVDHRGWTAEACWQDKSWNPSWFVAARTDAGAWTAEAAIPLSELTSQLPSAKHVWGVGARRIVPGVGVQNWPAATASELRPEAFGYLIFE